MRLTRRLGAVAAALTVAAFLAACGSSDNGGVIQPSGSSTPAPGGATTSGY